MDYKKYGNRYWLRIDRGEEIISSLKAFAAKEKVYNANVSGIGAVNYVIAGLYDTAAKKYHTNTFTGDMEIIALNGSITRHNDEVYLHLHIGLSDISGNMRGGHLNQAVVSGTCELSISVSDGSIGRRFDGETGLNLLSFLQTEKL